MVKFGRHFSVDEANALLPHFASLFERIFTLRAELDQKRKELEGVHKAAGGNGGDEGGSALVILSEVVGRLQGEIEASGVIVKDIESGLVDFPHMREGREVFLCWRVGEKAVSYWHELDAGFQGRQPL